MLQEDVETLLLLASLLEMEDKEMRSSIISQSGFTEEVQFDDARVQFDNARVTEEVLFHNPGVAEEVQAATQFDNQGAI